MRLNFKLFLTTIFLQIILLSSLSYGSSKTDWPSPVTDSETFGLLFFDLLEYRSAGKDSSLDWDVVGWRGQTGARKMRQPDCSIQKQAQRDP